MAANQQTFTDDSLPLEVCFDTGSSVCFTDASCGDHCYTGYVIAVGGNPVMWRPARQKLQSMSTAESELMAAVEGSQVLQGISLFAKEMNPDTELKEFLAVDNTAAIALCSPASSTPWRTRRLKKGAM